MFQPDYVRMPSDAIGPFIVNAPATSSQSAPPPNAGSVPATAPPSAPLDEPSALGSKRLPNAAPKSACPPYEPPAYAPCAQQPFPVTSILAAEASSILPPTFTARW